MPFTAQQLLASPEYYPLRFAEGNLQFVRMSRASYVQSTFTLPGRIVRIDDEVINVPLAQLIALMDSDAQPRRSPAVIFQIAHCGSTLLSKALDHPGQSLVIREPFALRQLLALPVSDDAAEQDARRRALNTLWWLYSRVYQPEERVLIKANVPVNLALAELQASVPALPGLLLYSDLEDYLLAVLKAEERRQWANHVVAELRTAIARDPVIHNSGLGESDLASLNGAQAALVLWLTQLRSYQQAIERQTDWRSLSSELLYQQPLGALIASADQLGLQLSDTQLQKTVVGELFTQHAKLPGQAYDAQTRERDMAALRDQYRGELDETFRWAEQMQLDLNIDLSVSAVTLPDAAA